MKIGEILRHLADAIDAEDNQSDVSLANVPDNAMEPAVDNSQDKISIGPLQQKHELLKKAAGVTNNAEQFADDEISQLQKNAGVAPEPTVITQTFQINPSPTAEPDVNAGVISQLADLTDSD
jgi:hypothetical protein